MTSRSRLTALPTFLPTVLPTVLVAGALLTACGNAADADILGRTAITVDSAGSPVAVVRVCHGHVDTVQLLGDRTGLADDEPNPVVGTWRAEGDRTGTVEVALTGANDGWTGPADTRLEADSTYVLIASDSGADAEASQVSFTPAQLADLDPGQVIVADGTVQDRSALDDCDE